MLTLSLDVASGGSRDCNQNGFPDECDIAPINFGFAWQAAVPAGPYPESLCLGDLDGDGDLDLAATNRLDHAVSILRNAGRAAFEPPSEFPVGEYPAPIVPADLDDDGRLDLATASQTGVSVLLNTGDAAFSEAMAIPLPSHPLSIQAGDLDGDGDQDLATAGGGDFGAGAGSVYALLNRGDGVFSGTSAPCGASPRSLALADLGGDGDLDMVVGDGARGVFLLWNQGEGTFLPADPFPRYDLRSAAAGDVDDDGDVDVAVLSALPEAVHLLLNGGQGHFFSSFFSGPFRVPPGAEFLALTDMDGDRRPDLLTANHFAPGTVSVLLNRGKASFAPAISYRADRWPVSFLASGDLDEDGDPDLAVMGRQAVSILLNQPVALSPDCDSNGIPDECEQDCNRNWVADACDLAGGSSRDCNSNRIPDECELDCDPDCNGNLRPDLCDIEGGASLDCNQNSVPDECEPDCDADRLPDDCEIAQKLAADCNSNGVPDPCELPLGDCDRNGIPDGCDLRRDPGLDCNRNGLPDECDLEEKSSFLPQAFAAAAGAGSIAAGDLDGDGDLDLAVGGRGYAGLQALKVLLNAGAGHFETASGHRLDPGAAAVALADLDGDGDLDLAAAAGGPGRCLDPRLVSILLNEGRGAFHPRSDQPIADPRLSSLALADLEGDGLPDVLAGGGAGLWSLRGLGRGELAPAAKIAEFPTSFAAGDLDQDGDVDIATGQGLLLFNSGDGTFPSRGRIAAGGRGVAAGDLDGDGDLDLATGNGLFLNLGRGTFGEPLPFPFQGGVLAAGDFDGDGGLDLFLTRESGLSLLWNDGEGVFFPGPQLAVQAGGVAAGDFDGNGTLDLAAPDRRSGVVRLLWNRGRGRFLAGALYPAPGPLQSLIPTDLDQDGDRDLVLSSTGAVISMENLGEGSFRKAAEIEVAAGSVASGDLDRDGDADLAVAGTVSTAATIHLLLNPGDGNFSAPVPLPAGNGPHALAAGDLDGDGDLDLAAANTLSSDLSVLLNRGNASFEEARSFPAGAYPTSLFALDLDGDGDLDLLVSSFGSSRVQLLLNEGGGGFRTGESILLEGEAASAASADFDRDGRPDLAFGICPGWGEHCWPSLAVLLNSGDLIFKTATYRDTAFRASSALAAADLDGDGDGDLDLARARTSYFDWDVDLPGEEVAVLHNRGDGTFEDGEAFFVGQRPAALAAADLDGSGPDDLAVGSSAGLSVFLNGPVGSSADRNRDGVPDECAERSFLRADATGDGQRDIADAVLVLAWLFQGAQGPTCLKSADCDDSGALDIGDPVFLLAHLFLGGARPLEPFLQCGKDRTPDPLSCDLYPPCP